MTNGVGMSWSEPPIENSCPLEIPTQLFELWTENEINFKNAIFKQKCLTPWNGIKLHAINNTKE